MQWKSGTREVGVWLGRVTDCRRAVSFHLSTPRPCGRFSFGNETNFMWESLLGVECRAIVADDQHIAV